MEVVAGLSAGAVSTIVTHPLDVIKIRLQVGAPNSFAFRSLWRGISPNLIGNTIAWGTYYGLYSKLRQVLNIKNAPALYWTSSFSAGAITSLLTNPIWVIKTRMVGSDSTAYKTMASSIKQVLAKDGVRGFWRGYPLSLMGTLQASVHFMIYDSIKDSFLTDWTPSLRYLVASGLSKTMAASIMYPHQVVRTRMQYTNDTFLKTVRQIWTSMGLRGFYKGVAPSIARVVPAMCITQVTYEYISSMDKK